MNCFEVLSAAFRLFPRNPALRPNSSNSSSKRSGDSRRYPRYSEHPSKHRSGHQNRLREPQQACQACLAFNMNWWSLALISTNSPFEAIQCLYTSCSLRNTPSNINNSVFRASYHPHRTFRLIGAILPSNFGAPCIPNSSNSSSYGGMVRSTPRTAHAAAFRGSFEARKAFSPSLTRQTV